MGKEFHYGQFKSPLRFKFKHASALRSNTQNVITSFSHANVTGYGEGCPREYVTGETVDSALNFVRKYGPLLATSVTDLPDLQNWIINHTELIDRNPAAFASIELGIIDCLARLSDQSVESLLGLSTLTTHAQYSAVLGDSNSFKTQLMISAYKFYGLIDYKMKISGDLSLDKKRLSLLPGTARVRLDANNLWESANESAEYIKALGSSAWAIEEPIGAFEYQHLKELSEQLNIPVILDESLFTKGHLERAKKYLDNAIVNIRVSKNGGILRAIDLANQCTESGFDVILGAQVAETSILTRAAITVGNGLKKPPMAREGAYGTLLLKNDLCRRSLRFTRGGRIETTHKLLGKPGFGLDVIPESIRWIA